MTENNSGPGRTDRTGLSLTELFRVFPDNEKAEQWFEAQRWPNGTACPECGSVRYAVCKDRRPMPYRCKDCRKFFSVRKGSVMQSSKLSYQDWAIAIYLVATSLKSVSSMKLHRDLKIKQSSAWYLAQRIREGFIDGTELMAGPVEADEVYIGGLEKNKHNNKKLKAGRGGVGKAAVVGVKDRETKQVRAKVVEKTNAETLQGFVREHAAPEATVYTDEATAYQGVAKSHETVKHTVGEYVRDMAHTNGIESFWSMLKRAHKGTFHKLSAKHLQRYVNEFAGRQNIRGLDTLVQMSHIVRGFDQRRLRYKDLVA